jgi:hypothetical protein
MSKKQIRESADRGLTDDQLNQVAGGTPSIPIPPPMPTYAIGRIEPRFPRLT